MIERQNIEIHSKRALTLMFEKNSERVPMSFRYPVFLKMAFVYNFRDYSPLVVVCILTYSKHVCKISWRDMTSLYGFQFN